MAKHLIVVESPSKANTVKKFLSGDFLVLASYGHIRDLIPKSGAVNPEENFSMCYEVIKKNIKHMEEIFKAFKQTDIIYLATDPDREGEAIAWHIYELMQGKGFLKNKIIKRITFHEITKVAIENAIKNPRDILMNLVDAQQARRALDYLVGFNLSPLLWKKIRYGLSAGRVQSPTLRMIVSREQEIESFISKEYWDITAECSFNNVNYSAKLIQYQMEKISQFSITNLEQANNIKQSLENHADGILSVIKVDKKKRIRKAEPPFTTSTLQQEASKRLKYSPKITMINAQKLYESGYITYMRTDSINLSNEALLEIRQAIIDLFGIQNLPVNPNIYKNKFKNAQEAHEAIRPTFCYHSPESIREIINDDNQIKLYELIWQRTIACQMIPATINTVCIDSQCNNGIFRVSGSTIVNHGFLNIYNQNKNEKYLTNILPQMNIGDTIDLKQIKNEQNFTKPPSRYNEANLIKKLEQYGIGRPSTYVTIIDTIINRKYVVLSNHNFKPTDIGKVVNKFLIRNFPKYVDYDFTAFLEKELDNIANGTAKFIDLMKNFWFPFKKLIDEVEQNVHRNDIIHETLNIKCPECNNNLSLCLGKNGYFIGCTDYPNCKYTAQYTENEKNINSKSTDRHCPRCNSILYIKNGNYGKFIGCSNYPLCTFVESLEKLENTNVKCPTCNEGVMLQKQTLRRKQIFYSCSHYPECKYAVWDRPINEVCPQCGWKIMIIKTTKKRGNEKICPQKNCNFTITI